MNKPMLLLATAPGPRGARRILETAIIDMGRKNGDVIAGFSLPSFRENFSIEYGILDRELKNDFSTKLSTFEESIHQTLKAIES